jgi:hypothetical protein
MAIGPSTTQTPYLVPYNTRVKFTSILSVGDSPDVKSDGAPWTMVGIPDGLGVFDNGDGTVTVLMNHELQATAGVVRDHGSQGAFVSELIVDKATLKVLQAGDLAQDVFTWDAATGKYVAGTTAWARFCSGDLAPQSAFYDAATGLGTTAKIYLTGEENGAAGRPFAFIATGPHAGDVYELPRLGNTSFENLVANAFTGTKTVVMAQDDSTPGQVYMYIGDKQSTGTPVDKAGLNDGALYGIKVDGLSIETAATHLAGDSAHFTLASLGDVSGLDGTQVQAASDAAGVTQFFRPEDGAWDPSHPNWYYFNTTASFNEPSRLWRLEYADINHPELGGVARMVLDGTEGQHMLDNMTVTQDGLVFLQEDPGNTPELAKVWMYDPKTDTLEQVANHDPSRFGTPPTSPFNQDEESSGILDLTSLFGDAHTKAFLLDTQAHYSLGGELVEGGQLQLMKVDMSNFITGTGRANSYDKSNSRSSWHINSGAGDDCLRGGRAAGADIIDGGRGADRVAGGLGDDAFVFSKASLGAKTADGGYDRIKDFEGAGVSGGDLVQFNGFSSAATLSYVSDGAFGLQRYDVTDGAFTTTLLVRSLNGAHLAAGDYVFT